MSFAIDVNVLLYASDTSSAHHERARTFLEEAVSGNELLCLSWATCMAYLRIATHPAVFGRPLAPKEAIDNLDALLSLPHVRTLAEDERFWDTYRELARQVTVRGNLVPDAHLAALLRAHGIDRLYTNDSDFRRFDFLDLRNPFTDQ